MERSAVRELKMEVRAELARRAEEQVSAGYLEVDYYRIRRRLAFPLPVRRLPAPEEKIGGIENYPWGTWLIWALEERLNCLGWAAEWKLNSRAAELAEADLRAMCGWESYRQYPKLDLLLAHSGRILSRAYLHWTWPGAELKSLLREALARLVEENLPKLKSFYGDLPDEKGILAAPEPKALVHNIAVLGALGLGLAAQALGEPEITRKINASLHDIVRALFVLRPEGYSEGISYDGHVLDFIVDWLGGLNDAERRFFTDNPQFQKLLDETFFACAPGDVRQTAPMSDVEPDHMRLPAVAQVKAFRFAPAADRAWYIRNLDVVWLPADGLAGLDGIAEALDRTAAEEPETCGVLDAHYLRVLRTGWRNEDYCVAMAVSNSPFAHVHSNNGNITIGHQGVWLLTAPGYQQYLPTSEREFTMGLSASNTPVIDGKRQSAKAVQVMRADEVEGARTLEVSLTGCYPEELGLKKLTRRVELDGSGLVRVEDEIVGPISTAGYYWHGHPEGAWWVENNRAVLRWKGTALWIWSPNCELTPASLQTLKGSRGQLTLTAEVAPMNSVVRWFFAIGSEPLAESLP